MTWLEKRVNHLMAVHKQKEEINSFKEGAKEALKELSKELCGHLNDRKIFCTTEAATEFIKGLCEGILGEKL